MDYVHSLPRNGAVFWFKIDEEKWTAFKKMLKQAHKKEEIVRTLVSNNDFDNDINPLENNRCLLHPKKRSLPAPSDA